MVQGYIFISVYNFIRFKNNELNHVFFKSIMTSYVLKSLFDFIFVKTVIVDSVSTKVLIMGGFNYNNATYTLGLCIFSFLLAYISAICIQSNRYNKIMLKLKINRTTNEYIWDDIIKPDCWLMIHIKDSNISYLGRCRYMEEFKEEPIISLDYYKIFRGETVVEDNSSDSNKMAVLNTKNFDRIEVIYQNND